MKVTCGVLMILSSGDPDALGHTCLAFLRNNMVTSSLRKGGEVHEKEEEEKFFPFSGTISVSIIIDSVLLWTVNPLN